MTEGAERARSPNGALGRSLLPRPLDEAQRRCRRQRYGDVLQAHPGEGKGYRGQRPLPPHRASGKEAGGQNEQAQHEQRRRRFQSRNHEGDVVEHRQRGEHQNPRQARQPGGRGDEGHAAGNQHDLERLDGEQRPFGVEYPVERRDQKQPEGVISVGARDAAIEGGELPLGQVAGDLEVVEGVIVRVGDQVDEIEAGEHVPSEPGPVGQDARDEQDEQRVVQPGGQSYPPIQAAGGQSVPATHWRDDIRCGHLLVHVIDVAPNTKRWSV